MNLKKTIILSSLLLTSGSIFAHGTTDICPNEASKTAIHSALGSLLSTAQAEENGGFGFNMWATVVNRAGEVCAIAYSGLLPSTNEIQGFPLKTQGQRS